MNKQLTGTILGLVLLAPLTEAEVRKGFYLSGGVGLQSLNLYGTDSVAEIEEDHSGFHTSFKIGGHLSPQWALYYQREASWWDYNIEDTLFVAGMSGLGATYFFSPETEAGYIEFGAGLGDITWSSENSLQASGSAFIIGAGYQFAKHAQAGAVLTMSATDDEYYSNISYETVSVAAKIEAKL